jgi:hypothetical protein
MWGSAIPPVSSGACHTSATVASLAHPKLIEGSCQSYLLQPGLFIYSLCGEVPLPLSLELKVPQPLCYMSFSVACLLFSFFFFCEADVSLSRGLWWFIPGVAVGVPCAAYLLTCWSASPKQVRSWHLAVQEPSWLLCILWCGETICRLGFGGVEVLPLLGVFSCLVCLQCLNKIFTLRSTHYLLPPCSHHLRSPLFTF